MMSSLSKIFIVISLLFTPIFSSATEESVTKQIIITDAWARATPGDMSALYFNITSDYNDTDYLISAESDVAGFCDIHKTVVENNVSRMVHVDKAAIPSGGKVEFKPGSLHIMLMNLKKPLKEGDKIKFTLYFQNNGAVTGEATVTKGSN